LQEKKLTDEPKSSLDAWLDYMDKLEGLDFSNLKDEAGFKKLGDQTSHNKNYPLAHASTMSQRFRQ
jgi:hypothetical protein